MFLALNLLLNGRKRRERACGQTLKPRYAKRGHGGVSNSPAGVILKPHWASQLISGIPIFDDLIDQVTTDRACYRDIVANEEPMITEVIEGFIRAFVALIIMDPPFVVAMRQPAVGMGPSVGSEPNNGASRTIGTPFFNINKAITVQRRDNHITITAVAFWKASIWISA
jgi:hypothetical protein